MFVVSGVTLPEGTNKIGRPPTYSIYNAWSKQTSTQYALPNNTGDEELGTLPSGQRRDAGAGVHRINIPSSPFHNLYFPPNAYRRRFIKDELVRVPFKMEGGKRVPIVILTHTPISSDIFKWGFSDYWPLSTTKGATEGREEPRDQGSV